MKCRLMSLFASKFPFLCVFVRESKRQYTDGPEQPNMCDCSHNVPFSAKWSVHLQTYSTDSNKQVLGGALLCIGERERGLFECVMWLRLSSGQGVGCEIVGIPGYCRLGPPNPPSLPHAALLSL